MKLRPFELSLVIIFAILAILSLVLLTQYDPEPDEDDLVASQVGVVKIWGTLPAKAVNGVLLKMTEENILYRNVTYSYLNPNNFDDALLNALADDRSPDLILISHEKLATLRHRIQPISYDSYPLRDIKSLYLDGAHIFALSDGLYGLPIAIDPIVMYWNKDILAKKNYITPPATWEFLINDMFPRIIDKDFERNINLSVLALGEYTNIRNAYGIISALLLQSGSLGVVESSDKKYLVKLQVSPSGGNDTLEKVASFYTRFSNPSNVLYSWNRSFEEDRKMFISEKLAFYFGYGSEGYEIERSNPNLNFDIAEIPQGANATVRRTYGKIYAMSIVKASNNKVGAGIILSKFGSPDVAGEIAINNQMVPARRVSVNLGSDDIYGRVSFRSATIAFGWLNPNIDDTNSIFKTMIEDINENRRSASLASNDAVRRIKEAY